MKKHLNDNKTRNGGFDGFTFVPNKRPFPRTLDVCFLESATQEPPLRQPKAVGLRQP